MKGKFMSAPPNTILRELPIAPPAIMPAAQPNLTADQIKRAIQFNKDRYDDPRTREIQDLAGTTPTGTWVGDDIVMIASLQEEYGYTKDGMVGVGFFRFLDLVIRRLKSTKTDKNCLIAFRIAGPDAPVVSPVAGGSRSITGHFRMLAQFSKYCGCADYEYRQFIRGHWKRTRGGITTDLGGTFTSEPAGALTPGWQEDGNTTAAAVNYGHRAQTAEGINQYVDDTGATDQAGGCRFEGDDSPGGPDSVMSGDVFDVDVNFRGEIQRKGSAVETKHWTAIKGMFPVP
jgi:hypothetical protein